MGKVFGISLMLMVCNATYADQSAVNEFARKAQSLGKSISADDSGESERCRELSRDVERLAGKPQRRYTARQDYMLECQREPTSPPEPYTTDSGL